MTLKLKRNLFHGGIVVVTLLLCVSIAYAGITYSQPTPENRFDMHEFFSATTTTATSTNHAFPQNRTVRLDGAKKVDFTFARSAPTGTNTGSSTFTVQVSNDQSTWFYWGKWAENASTTPGFTSSTKNTAPFVLSATSTNTAGMVLDNNAYRFARCIVTEVLDGQHSCSVSVQY